MGNEEKNEYLYFISANLLSSQCFSFHSKMQTNLHKSLVTHTSGDLLTRLVFQLDLFSTHETF